MSAAGLWKKGGRMRRNKSVSLRQHYLEQVQRVICVRKTLSLRPPGSAPRTKKLYFGKKGASMAQKWYNPGKSGPKTNSTNISSSFFALFATS